VLVLMSAGAGATSEPAATIAVLPKDPHREKWDGKRVGAAAAAELLGVDAAVELAELRELVAAAAAASERVYGVRFSDKGFHSLSGAVHLHLYCCNPITTMNPVTNY
jgi:hypothetical protein